MKKLLRARAKLSLLLQFTMVMLVVGVALAFIELFGSGYTLFAYGCLLISLTLAVATYKAHTAASEIRRARLEVASLRREVANQAKQQSRKQNSAPASTPKRAPNLPHARVLRALERSESQQRMRAIGIHTPRVIDPSAKGRQAAAVEPDRNRPHRLYAATEGILEASGSGSRRILKRKIGVIGTETLRSVLEEEFALTVMLPGISEAQFEADAPAGLVIEEEALQSGAWASALSASGIGLLKEIIALRDKTVAGAYQVYVIPSNTVEVSTRLLRDKATLVVDRAYSQTFIDTRHETEDEEQNGSIITRLVQYLAI